LRALLGNIKLLNARKGIAELVDMVCAGVLPMLLCGERNPKQYHRSLIAEKVAKRNHDLLLGEQLGLQLDPRKKPSKRKR